MAFNSFIYNNQPMTFNGFAIGIGDYVPPTPPTPSYYSGFTYGTTGELRMTIDPADGVSKNLTASYYQIEGGDWSGRYTTNPAGGLGDCLGIYAPSAGVYSLVWDNWRTYIGSNSIVYRSDGSLTTASLTSIKSMDFWGKRAYNAANPWGGGYDFRGKNIVEIPQSPENLHNGENLSSFSGFFANNRSLTSNLIPFIIAMKVACPNLQNTSACFSGCTAAADYAQATAQYPGWF